MWPLGEPFIVFAPRWIYICSGVAIWFGLGRSRIQIEKGEIRLDLDFTCLNIRFGLITH